MTILALDTSGPLCSVAIAVDGLVRYEARVQNKLTHSVNLMPMVDEALGRAAVKREELDYFACVVGPGSFTGVRIAVAAAQGLARGLGIPCIAINALEMMAKSLPSLPGTLCPIRDARSQQVYGAAFSTNGRLLQDVACTLDEYLSLIGQFSPPYTFLGDGALAYQQAIQQRLGAQASFVPAHLLLPGAAAACSLAAQALDTAMDPQDLQPLYLRVPQAERMLAQKKAHEP